MKLKFATFCKLLLTFCLLFTFSFTNSVTASSEEDIIKVKSNINIKVIENDDVFFKLVAEDEEDNSTYSVSIIEQEDNHYQWESRITINDKKVSETEFTITEIKDNFNPIDLERHLSNVLTGENHSEDLENYLNEVFKISSKEIEFNNKYSQQNNEVGALVVPLVIPLAAGAISTSTLAALEAALFAAVATATATVATAILEERHRSSNETAEVRTKDTYPDNWSDFTGIPSGRTTSATKHIELEGLNEIAERIRRDRNNDGNLEVFVSTTDIRESVLLVFDINSSLRTTVNRHLGNYIDGSRMSDTTYRNERLNLNGYTVFLIYNYRDQQLFHAHFVPQADRREELKYMRYVGNFDLQIFDKVRHTPSYNEHLQRTETERSDYERKYRQAKRDRNLLRDSDGNKSVVPYKN